MRYKFAGGPISSLVATTTMLMSLACGSPPTPTHSAVPSTASSPLPAFVRRELSAWQPNPFSPLSSGPVAYLSTDPLLSSCVVDPDLAPNPTSSNGYACDWPLEALSPDGLFIKLVSTRILQPLPTVGTEIELNGAVAYLEISKPGRCAEIGADEQLTVGVPPPGSAVPRDMSNMVIFGCIRGPHLAELEQQFRDALTRLVSTNAPSGRIRPF
jgi:hypothetical protein